MALHNRALRSGTACLALLGGAIALQHSAMWGLNSAAEGAGWATLTFDVGNLTAIEENFDTAGMVALLPLSWTKAQPTPCHSPVPHMCTTPPSCNFSCIMLDPLYQDNIDKLYNNAETQRLIKKGAVVGTFLGDEHLYFGVQLHEVKAVADALRLAFPTGIVYMNEAPDIAMCNFRKDNTTIFAVDECLPNNVDWFGFDFYQVNPSALLLCNTSGICCALAHPILPA